MAKPSKNILRTVFNNDFATSRYVPRSLTGSLGWGVFDKKRDRFLSDDEVRRINPNESLTH